MTTTGPPHSRRSLLGRAYVEHLARQPIPGDPAAAARDSTTLTLAYRDRFLNSPAFLSASERRAVTRDLRMIYDLLRSLPERMFDGDLHALAEAVGMNPSQAKLIVRSARTGSLVPLGRADLYHDGTLFRLLEFNITSALGGFENADINQAMLMYPPLREFTARHELRYRDTLGAMVRTMRAECAAAISAEQPPFVAVVDTVENFSIVGPRLKVFAAKLADYGIEGIACHPDQITYPLGRPTVAGRAIDVIFRYFLVEDFTTPKSAAQLEPLLCAAEQEKVAIFSRLDSELYGSKGALAMLSDDRHRSLFDADELACVDRLLPWTRHVRPRVTDAGGSEVDLLTYALAEQSELVLKPTSLHGGSGIVVGWKVGAAQWERHLTSAIGGPFVLQRRIRPAPEPFPDGVGGSQNLFLNWGIYVGADDVIGEDGYAGCFVRGVSDPTVGVVSLADGASVGCAFHDG